MCDLKNHILLFNQHSVIYLLASHMSCIIYLINNKLSYHRDVLMTNTAGRLVGLSQKPQQYTAVDMGCTPIQCLRWLSPLSFREWKNE